MRERKEKFYTSGRDLIPRQNIRMRFRKKNFSLYFFLPRKNERLGVKFFHSSLQKRFVTMKKCLKSWHTNVARAILAQGLLTSVDRYLKHVEQSLDHKKPQSMDHHPYALVGVPGISGITSIPGKECSVVAAGNFGLMTRFMRRGERKNA